MNCLTEFELYVDLVLIVYMFNSKISAFVKLICEDSKKKMSKEVEKTNNNHILTSDFCNVNS